MNSIDWNKLWNEKQEIYGVTIQKHVLALELIQEIEKIEKINTIGDFGCGIGTILKTLSLADKYRLFAFDQSNYAQEEFNSLGITFNQVDLSNFTLEQELDIAILTDVLEHFFEPEKVLKSLKKAKYIIVIVPNFSELTQRFQVLKGSVPFQMKPKRGGHVYWFNYDEFIKVCTQEHEIIYQKHSYPRKINKFSFLKKYPNIFAHQFGAILKT